MVVFFLLRRKQYEKNHIVAGKEEWGEFAICFLAFKKQSLVPSQMGAEIQFSYFLKFLLHKWLALDEHGMEGNE